MINGIKEPAFWMGVVEDRRDPLKIGRVRARVIGLHTHDKTILPTADLPWAYCIQPVNSAAISGIGVAPVGPLEGTWVAIQYLDQDRQSPFVVGTLPGISSAGGSFFTEAPSQGGDYEVNAIGDVTAPWLDYGDEPIGDGKFNLPGTYTTSKSMIDEIKSVEAFRAKPYKDVGGVWTIGYGTTYIDRIKVSSNTPEVNAARAEELLRIDVKAFENVVKSVVLVPITQSMFDAMVSLCYNIGPNAFRQSTLQRLIDQKNYSGAASEFMRWDKVGGKPVAGLTSRRTKEKAWFLREGVGGEAASSSATASNAPAGGAAPTSHPQKILGFGSASGISLDSNDVAKIVGSVPVKVLDKAEYVSNIDAPPGVYTVGQSGTDTSGGVKPPGTSSSV